MPQLLSVQTGQVRRLKLDGRSVVTAYGKQPVAGPVPVTPLGLLGDAQADRRLHGGPDKALYAYPSEHYAFWQALRAQKRPQASLGLEEEALPCGSLGENLTLRGLLEHGVWAGDVLVFPHCVVQVTEAREPCYKFSAAMGFAHAARAMADSGFCGFYLSVLTPGSLCAGEAFTLVPGPRRVSIPQLFARRMGRRPA